MFSVKYPETEINVFDRDCFCTVVSSKKYMLWRVPVCGTTERVSYTSEAVLWKSMFMMYYLAADSVGEDAPVMHRVRRAIGKQNLVERELCTKQWTRWSFVIRCQTAVWQFEDGRGYLIRSDIHAFNLVQLELILSPKTAWRQTMAQEEILLTNVSTRKYIIRGEIFG